MLVNYRSLNLCSFIFIITFVSLSASFCSNLTSTDDQHTPCFLEPSAENPIVLRTSGNSLILPCHVARSKRSSVEWWYTDSQKLVNIKIYPVYPPVRPTVLRFVTSLNPHSKDSNETDILDASILLRHVNVDDSGIYRCVIRSWAMDPLEQAENTLSNDDSNAPSLNYRIQLTGPRLCQLSTGALPCFTAMRTSSPTVIDAYQTAFLQCVVKNHNRPSSVFWVVGDSSVNSVLITDYLTTNQYQGDRLRRVFPLSPYDYSIEVSVNHTSTQRVYSCVIDGATDLETTLFTYIIRSIDLEEVSNQVLNTTHKIASHDTLNSAQIHSLREHQKEEITEEHSEEEQNHEERSEEEQNHEERSEEENIEEEHTADEEAEEEHHEETTATI